MIDRALPLRKKVFEQIDALLGERAPLAPPRGAARVCDAGCALMQEVLYWGAEPPDPYPGEEAFLALPEAERDRRIMLARGTRVWGLLR